LCAAREAKPEGHQHDSRSRIRSAAAGSRQGACCNRQFRLVPSNKKAVQKKCPGRSRKQGAPLAQKRDKRVFRIQLKYPQPRKSAPLPRPCNKEEKKKEGRIFHHRLHSRAGKKCFPVAFAEKPNRKAQTGRGKKKKTKH